MLLKSCSICGDLSDRGRCPAHRPQRNLPKTSSTSRGYDYAWKRLSERARRMQPFCTDCGTTEDLTTDHSPEAWTAREQGRPITLDLVAVVCRSCNARRGRARPD